MKVLLEERSMTQKQFADSFNISASTISNYVQNIREPDYETLKRFADYFDVTTDYLLNRRTSKNISPAEVELLRVFRSLTKDQQEIYIEQGKIFITHNNKKLRCNESKIAEAARL